MSSIYQKGRDGYYYYQTYVLNKETGKKNKKVFHSLGTRDLSEAKIKQDILDKKYEKKLIQGKQKYFRAFYSKLRFIFVVGVTICITIIILTLFDAKEQGNSSFSNKNAHIEKKNKNVIDVKQDRKIEKLLLPEKKVNSAINTIIAKKAKVEVSKVINKSQPSIPEYSIARIQPLSDLFKQGKIFINVKKDTDEKSLELLCEKVASDYSEFANIIICLYADNNVGKEMASGKVSKINSNEQREAWLAMYTYNPVEGSYFDGKPGRYLGSY